MQLQKYFSRKFILTVMISCMSVGAPLVYKTQGVSDTITLAVIGILAGIGAAYGFINVKDAQIDKTPK